MIKDTFNADDIKLEEVMSRLMSDEITFLDNLEISEPHKFSAKFESEMKNIFSSRKNISKRIKKRRRHILAAAVAAVMFIMGAVAMSAEAISEPIINWIFTVIHKGRGTSISFETKSPEELPKIIEARFSPSYIPEGFKLDESSSYERDTYIDLAYVNEENQWIYYSQSVIADSNSVVNTENIEEAEISVNDFMGITYSNRGVQTIIWSNDEYLFKISGDVDENETMLIAASVQSEE